MHATTRMAKNATSKYQRECCNEGGLQLEKSDGSIYYGNTGCGVKIWHFLDTFLILKIQ